MSPHRPSARRPRRARSLALGAAIALVLPFVLVGRALAIPGQGSDAASAGRAEESTTHLAAGRRLSQLEGLRLDVRPAFGGHSKPNAWFTVWVSLENDGPSRDVELQLVDAAGSQVLRQVELPRGARKSVPIMVRTRGGESNLLLQIREDGAEIDRRRVPVSVAPSGRVAALLLEEPRDLPGLEGLVKPGAEVVAVSAAELPDDALGWAALDHLLLSGTALDGATPDQRLALARWVALGGQLSVLGGQGAAAAAGSLPEELRAANVGALRNVDDFRGLEALAGGTLPQGEGVVAALEPLPGAKVVAALEDGSPIALARRYGDGTVSQLAIDVAQPPFEFWGGNANLWQLLDHTRSDTAWRARVLAPSELANMVRTDLDVDLPSTSWLILLILGYVLLVGPVNYLVLKRRERLDLAWVTIPALTLATSVLTYGFGRQLHGTELVLRELSVVRVVPEAKVALVTGYVGLFSPQSRSYDLELERGLAYPVQGPFGTEGSGATYRQGAEPGVGDLRLDQWSMAGVAVEAVVPWDEAGPAGPVGPGGGVNPFGRSIDDAQLRSAALNVSVGNLAENGAQGPASASFRPDLQQYRRQVDAHLRRQMSSWPYRGDEALLSGWAEDEAFGATVRGRKAQRAPLALYTARVRTAEGVGRNPGIDEAPARSPREASRSQAAAALSAGPVALLPLVVRSDGAGTSGGSGAEPASSEVRRQYDVLPLPLRTEVPDPEGLCPEGSALIAGPGGRADFVLTADLARQVLERDENRDTIGYRLRLDSEIRFEEEQRAIRVSVWSAFEEEAFSAPVENFDDWIGEELLYMAFEEEMPTIVRIEAHPLLADESHRSCWRVAYEVHGDAPPAGSAGSAEGAAYPGDARFAPPAPDADVDRAPTQEAYPGE